MSTPILKNETNKFSKIDDNDNSTVTTNSALSSRVTLQSFIKKNEVEKAEV